MRVREYEQQWRFHNRAEAGKMLARYLGVYANRPEVLVLGLPRGGIPVAFEVARALHAPLDLLIVRKLGVPGERELAIGALASGGVRVLNQTLIRALQVPAEVIAQVTAEEQQELARQERLYRGSWPPPTVRGRTIILVDDGIATGSTLRAAILALREQQPARLVVAIPVAPASAGDELRPLVDELVCVLTPETFVSVGQWYADFSQTRDDEVRALLECARSEQWRNEGEAAEPSVEQGDCEGSVRRRRHFVRSA
jgi:putative phosphoribosyl transferase